MLCAIMWFRSKRRPHINTNMWRSSRYTLSPESATNLQRRVAFWRPSRTETRPHTTPCSRVLQTVFNQPALHHKATLRYCPRSAYVLTVGRQASLYVRPVCLHRQGVLPSHRTTLPATELKNQVKAEVLSSAQCDPCCHGVYVCM
jgi:hypothetical protein